MKSDLAHFRERYQHAWNKINWHVPDDLKTGKFVDIGCGIGNGVAAATAHGAKVSVGIDRSFEEFSDVFTIEDFPSLCRAVGSTDEASILLGGDIFEMSFPSGQFDYAMMLDSAEHVPEPIAFFQWAYDALKPGGCFVMDTCPLFFSPVGAHLWSYFPPDTAPWAHLRPDFPERCKNLGVSDWSMQRFDELNRATHDDLRNAFEAVGFTVTLEHRSVPDAAKLELFDRYGPELDLTNIKKEWLFEDWILLVGRK